MSENPLCQEEHYYVTLRKFLRFAELQKYKAEKAEGWEEKLGIQKAAKGGLTELHNIILEIDMHKMFGGRIREMCLKVIKLLTDIIKSEGGKFSTGLILN